MVEVNQIVRETLALRAYEQRVSNITVLDALATGLPQVFADGYQIQQVLLNLVINAEQAMPQGGEITIQAARRPGGVSLSLIDTGKGMPPEVLAKVFRPFFSTRKEGTGLGLPTTRRIIEAHDRRVRLEQAGLAVVALICLYHLADAVFWGMAYAQVFELR